MSITRITIRGKNAQADLTSENFSTGAARILIERYRVMDIKGRTTESDLNYELDELINAAGAYLFGPGPTASTEGVPYCWPFTPDYWHGGQDRIADLVRAGQFIAAEIDRLTMLAELAQNPTRQTDTAELASAGVKVPTGKPPAKKLLGFRPDGFRSEANPDTLSPTARVFEPGMGSDPATWFGYGTDDKGSPPIEVPMHIHDSDTAYDGVCKNCDPTQAQQDANPRLRHDGRRILRCDKSRELAHKEHNWESSFLPVWCPGHVAAPADPGD